MSTYRGRRPINFNHEPTSLIDEDVSRRQGELLKIAPEIGISTDSVVRTSENLSYKFITPLGKNDTIISLIGVEEVSKPYEIDLIFVSVNPKIDFAKLLNKQATVEIEIGKNKKFYLSGIIKTVSQGITHKKGENLLTEYSAILVPNIYKLGLTKHYSFYQNKSALDVIKDIIKKNKIKNVEYKVSKLGNRKRDSCIQYNETDLFFITRLMQEEGLFYFFKHDLGKEMLVIADSNTAFVDSKLIVSIQKDRFNERKSKQPIQVLANRIVFQETMLPNKYLIDEYDYNKPNSKLSNNCANRESKSVYGDIYEYGLNYTANSDGKNIANTKMEAVEYKKNYITLESDALLSPGQVFSIEDHNREELNTKYFVSRVEHSFGVGDTVPYFSTIEGYNNSKVKCRSMLVLEKPRIYGYISAIVTGPSNQDVFRDELARIKVRFLWDLEGKKNKEKSSGWVRVAETFAGSNFGAIFLPRVGQEVIVVFMDGDPDRPLVVGALYNGLNKPPYKDADISCIKTQTLGDKKRFNELKFIDKKQKEQIYVRAQKDLEILINENANITLKKGNYTLTLEKGNVKVEVKGSINVHATKDISFKADKNITLDANQSITLNAKKDITFKAQKNMSSTAKLGKYTVSSMGAAKFTSKQGLDISGLNVKIDAKMKASMTAKMGIDIKSTMTMNLSCNLSMSIKSNLNLGLSGTILNMKANAINSIGGALIKIG